MLKLSNYVLTSNGELYHFGIKGMKWGVRRYQNKNGSLTPAGKKRYSDDPEIKALKSDTREAKKNMKVAEKAYNKALNRASYVPTSKRIRETLRKHLRLIPNPRQYIRIQNSSIRPIKRLLVLEIRELNSAINLNIVGSLKSSTRNSE